MDLFTLLSSNVDGEQFIYGLFVTLGFNSLFFLFFFVFFDFKFFHFLDNLFHFIDNFFHFLNNFFHFLNNFFNFLNNFFAWATSTTALLGLIFAGFVKVLYEIRHIIVIIGIVSSVICSVSRGNIGGKFFQVCK